MAVSEPLLVFPDLERPPLVEVVCGVTFEPIDELEPLLLGVYWSGRRTDFPKRQVLPALSEEVGFALGTPPMRAMLISEDEQFVVQAQADRFLMNWRFVGKQYPRFSDRHGPKGLASRTQAELKLFGEFVLKHCGKELKVRGVEVAKIDLLEQEKHWRGLDDLVRLIPAAGAFSEVHRSEDRDVDLRYVDKTSEGRLIVNIGSLRAKNQKRAVRIESRFIADKFQSVASALEGANQVLNRVFFKLVPNAKDAFGARLGKGES